MPRLSFDKVPDEFMNPDHFGEPYSDPGGTPQVGDRVRYNNRNTEGFHGRVGTIVAVRGAEWYDSTRNGTVGSSDTMSAVCFDGGGVSNTAGWSCSQSYLVRVNDRKDTVVMLLRYDELDTLDELIKGGLMLGLLDYKVVRRDVEAVFAEAGEPVPYSVELMLTRLRDAMLEHEMEFRRENARGRLELRMATWVTPTVDRFEDLWGDRENKTYHTRDLGLAVAKLARDPHNIDYANAVRRSEYFWALNNRLPPEKVGLATALTVCIARFNGGDGADGKNWKHLVWADESWFRDKTRRSNDASLWWHMTHVSEKDPTLIAYHQNVDKMIRDVQTPMKPGAYLKKFFGDVLNDAEIKTYAERHIVANTPPKLHFVESDDPDGWEAVYENGTGFTSCMTYDRSGRYIHNELHGENHPVRSYAYPGNGLRLAWLGRPSPSGHPEEVHSRAVVVEAQKRAIRVYGDDRMREVLEGAGYSIGGGIEGIRLVKRPVPWDEAGGFIVPYVDGDCQNLKIMDDHILVDRNGDGSSPSSGWINNAGRAGNNDEEYDEDSSACDCCGEVTNNDNMYSTFDGYGDDYICSACIGEGERYVWAYSRHSYTTVIPADEAVFNEDNREYYDNDRLGNHGVEYSEYEDKYRFVDNMVNTSRGLVGEDKARELDEDDEDGNSWAVEEDVVKLRDGRLVHCDSLGCDVVTDSDCFIPEAMSFWGTRSRYAQRYEFRTGTFIDLPTGPDYVMADNLREYIDEFAVLGDWLVHDATGTPYGAIPLHDWLLASSNYERLANVQDADDGNSDWSMVLDEIRDELLEEMIASTEEVEEDDVVLLDIPQQQQAA